MGLCGAVVEKASVICLDYWRNDCHAAPIYLTFIVQRLNFFVKARLLRKMLVDQFQEKLSDWSIDVFAEWRVEPNHLSGALSLLVWFALFLRSPRKVMVSA